MDPVVYKDGYGIEIYTLNGVLHREDGPAVVSPMHQEWYIHGQLHRSDGPARMFHSHPNGGQHIAEWWFFNKEKNASEYVHQANLDHETFHCHLHKGDK